MTTDYTNFKRLHSKLCMAIYLTDPRYSNHDYAQVITKIIAEVSQMTVQQFEKTVAKLEAGTHATQNKATPNQRPTNVDLFKRSYYCH